MSPSPIPNSWRSNGSVDSFEEVAVSAPSPASSPVWSSSTASSPVAASPVAADAGANGLMQPFRYKDEVRLEGHKGQFVFLTVEWMCIAAMG